MELQEYTIRIYFDRTSNKVTLDRLRFGHHTEARKFGEMVARNLGEHAGYDSKYSVYVDWIRTVEV